MGRHDSERFDDRRLEALFSTLNRNLTDAEFTAHVMRRVRETRLRRAARALVIAVAAAIGIGAAFGTLIDLITGALGSASHVWAALRAEDAPAALGWAQMYRLPLVAAALCLAAWPVLARWIAR
jgi:hypothetical protein